MLTLKVITENPDEVVRKLAKKHFDAKEAIAKVLELDKVRRSSQAQLDAALAEINTLSKSVGSLMKEGKKDFFEMSAEVYIAANIGLLRKHKGGIYCDIPHLIELLGQSYEATFHVIQQDPELSIMIQPYADALLGLAMEQLQGQVATLTAEKNTLTQERDAALAEVKKVRDAEIETLLNAAVSDGRIFNCFSAPLNPCCLMSFSATAQRIKHVAILTAVPWSRSRARAITRSSSFNASRRTFSTHWRERSSSFGRFSVPCIRGKRCAICWIRSRSLSVIRFGLSSKGANVLSGVWAMINRLSRPSV